MSQKKSSWRLVGGPILRYGLASKLFKTSGAYFWTYPREGAQKVLVFFIDCRKNHFNTYIYMYMSLGKHSFLCNSSASKKSGGSAQDPKRSHKSRIPLLLPLEKVSSYWTNKPYCFSGMPLSAGHQLYSEDHWLPVLNIDVTDASTSGQINSKPRRSRTHLPEWTRNRQN